MSKTIYVVIAGPSYGHADPRKAFESRTDAKTHASDLESDYDWTDVKSVNLQPYDCC